MALLLACVRHIVPLHNYVMDGGWSDPTRQPPLGKVSHHVYGQTIGLVGFGNIGRAVAKRALAFDLRVIAYDPFTPKEVYREAGVTHATLGRVLQDSDFVSLHVPLTESTYHLIGAPQFRLMKPSALLINTCRGPVIDEAALIEALNSGQILGAGLDVTETEPIEPTNPLLNMSNVVITPHTASVSDLAGAERRRRPSHEIVAVLTGHRPRAVWNPDVLKHLHLV
jgi:phosphoglycerate dehydrogenase-like enzyme